MILCCSLQLMLMLASVSNFFCFCKFSSCVIYFKSLAHKLLWASVHPVSHVYVAHVGCTLREGQSLSFTSHYGGGIILKASLKWLHEVNPKSVTVTGSRSSSMLGDQSWLFVLFYFLSLPRSSPELLRLSFSRLLLPHSWGRFAVNITFIFMREAQIPSGWSSVSSLPSNPF